MDESMHKSIVSLGVGGGETKGKVSVIEVSVNNPGPMFNNEGLVVMLMMASIVGMTLDGVVGPCGSW